MAERNDFRTGDNVEDRGCYICEAGIREDLEAGDQFPSCPESGEETSWRRDQ